MRPSPNQHGKSARSHWCVPVLANGRLRRLLHTGRVNEGALRLLVLMRNAQQIRASLGFTQQSCVHTQLGLGSHTTVQ